MNGRKVLIAGGTAGIGRAAAVALARMGASVTIIGRAAERTATAAREIAAEAGAGSVAPLACDLSSNAEVRRAAAEFLAKHDRLDVLALNAGGFLATRRTSVDGNELTLAFGYLGQFLLGELLLPALRASGAGRVVVTGIPPSGLKLNLDDLQWEKSYSWMKATPNAITARIMYALDLAEREAGKGVTANFFQPGIIATDLFKEMPWFMRVLLKVVGSKPEKGADTLVWLASAPELKGVTGRYFYKRKEGKITGQVADPAVRARLREISLRLTGLAA